MSEQLYSINAGNFLLSSLLNNTGLLYSSSYPLTKEDFRPNLSHKIIYITICQLADRGCNEIDAKELVTYLESGYEEQYNALKEDISDGNVVSYIDTLKQLDNTKSYEYWYNEIRKRSLLRLYRDNGFDISKFWDEDKSEEKNIAKLNKYSIKDIVTNYDTIQAELRQQYVIDETVRRIKAGENYEEIKEAFKNTPYFGACMESPYQTTLFRGWVKGQVIMNSAPSGMGKAQPIDTIIPTPNGNKRLGDIKIGDYVFDRYGKPTKVLGVYPQGVIDNYKVTFKDGRSTYCNNEHLWNVTYHNYHKWVNKTVDTNFIINHLNKKYHTAIAVPTCGKVEYEKKDLRIDPYVFGCFLGDGCCTIDELELSSVDKEIVNEMARLINATAKYRGDRHWGFEINDGTTEYRYNDNNRTNKFYHTKQFFKEYEKYITCYSYEKSIPNEYKYSSVEQRYALLQGLFDTDGCISKRAGITADSYDVTYVTTSEKLKDDILEIVYSLGYRASFHKYTRKSKPKHHLPIYRINMHIDNNDKNLFFRLSRKKNIAIEASKNTQYRKYDKNDIISIEKMPNPCEMVCIYVDNEEHLYLTNDYIVTHNTVRAVGELCKVCATELWDDDKQAFVPNLNRKGSGLYINTEMDLELELTPCFLAYISNIPRSDIMDGVYKNKEEEERVDKAIQILRDSNIFLIDDPNFTLRSIEDNIKFYKEQCNIQYMVFDYLQDNGVIGKEMKTTNEIIARDTIILNMASNFKVFARQYDIGIYTMSQLNGQEKTAEIIDESCLAGGRAVKNKLDAGCISLYPRKKEQKFTEGLLTHWLSENRNGKFGESFKPNTVLHNYKVRFSKYGVGIKIYQYLDKSTGRCIDMYCTDLYDNPINIDKTIVESA